MHNDDYDGKQAGPRVLLQHDRVGYGGAGSKAHNVGPKAPQLLFFTICTGMKDLSE